MKITEAQYEIILLFLQIEFAKYNPQYRVSEVSKHLA